MLSAITCMDVGGDACSNKYFGVPLVDVRRTKKKKKNSSPGGGSSAYAEYCTDKQVLVTRCTLRM